MTEETAVLGGRIKGAEISIGTANKNHDYIVNKTADLEDRSRRNNVIFYNIPEPTSESKDSEDCDAIIMNLLKSRGFFENDYTLEIDRAHRLGRKKPDSDRPRPIIVRFSFYKDKDHIIKNGKLLKNCEVNASEDFSKLTQDIHKQLRHHAKEAKVIMENDNELSVNIVNYKITYRRVVVTYKTKNSSVSSPTFTRIYSLQFINSNAKWFVPPPRRT